MNNMKTRSINWYHISVILTLLLVLLFIFRQPLYNQLNSWDLIPKPELYTELYFTDNPPSVVVPGKQYALSFTVHNVEYQTITYTYAIEQLDSNDTVIARLSKNTFTLSQDGSTTIKAPITLINNSATAKVRVTLTFTENGKKQPATESIYYLVRTGE